MDTQPALAPPTLANSTVAIEAARRRTFAIIAHPDAGKTTLTEKLLLQGRRHPAGRGRAGPRAMPAGPARTG